ncbi:uncharacterized protein BT62DRAFT_631136 [Guyanagaster necrorhizus]|uniref:Uncharacterized protein n=1 Tax=Guyanagaster necrorhizus TaxID=856835 RepID=A0A9P7VFX9_9AGAR|nr:uncharacterized protein BT62DRAFT_631136 [Guyanagaster necrorhizus MCA 3950]KAG7440218.1 hypothetical protein BT62DRAFT_631136 [Guyanagaster necrorhizus MCA 3950]
MPPLMSLTMRLLVVVSLAGRNDHEEDIKQMYSYLVQADVKRDEGGLYAFSRHASSSTTFMIPMPSSAPDTIARIHELDNDNLTGVSRWLVSLMRNVYLEEVTPFYYDKRYAGGRLLASNLKSLFHPAAQQLDDSGISSRSSSMRLSTSFPL